MNICNCQRQCTFAVGAIASYPKSADTPSRKARKSERCKVFWHNYKRLVTLHKAQKARGQDVE